MYSVSHGGRIDKNLKQYVLSTYKSHFLSMFNMGSIISICGSDTKKTNVDNVSPIISIKNESKDQKNVENPVVRFFMAGLGSAGKTTVIRQLQLLASNSSKKYSMYDEDWNEYDPDKWKKDFEKNVIWKNIIRKNILDTFNIIIKYNESENIEYDTEDNFNFAMDLSESLDEDEDYEYIRENETQFLNSLIMLFEDSYFTNAFKHKNKIKMEGKKLFDGCDHFMKKEKIIEVFSDNYIPTEDDKVRSRYPTQDMRTYRFKMFDTKIEINDIGGQKSERSKVGEFVKHWSLQGNNDSRNFILLVVGMSDYNEKHDEYEGTLLDECLEYMKNLLSNPYASKCGLLIFFNKRDKFLEKLKDADCRDDVKYLKPYLDRTVYNEYKNTGNFKEEDMHKAIASKFAEIINSNKIKRERDTYCRFTCAIDKVMMESIFGTVYHELLKNKTGEEELFP